jgi:two-component system, NarL family, invasion response regulator UvrY
MSYVIDNTAGIEHHTKTESKTTMLKILIADDHEIVRRGLKQILLEGFSFAEVEEAHDCPSLVERAKGSEWNIIISDLAMPGGGGLEALKQIKQFAPNLPVLILSIYPEEQYALRVIKAGAAGYLTKDAAPEELVTAVNRILSGRRYITEGITEKLVQQLDDQGDVPVHELLSDREWDVFRYISQGKSVSEISQLMAVKSTTVSTYRTRILTKMNLKTNADIIHYALENNLL